MYKKTINNNELFFELLCVAIGTRKNLSITPSAEQWRELFALSKKQALVAVAFRGLSKLKDFSSEEFCLAIDEITYFNWLGLTAKIAQRNNVLNKECAKVCKQLVHDGFKTIVLKGQSNLHYYPADLHDCRTAGDIDVWVCPFEGINIAVSLGYGVEYATYFGKSAVVEYAKMIARLRGKRENIIIRYHHVELPLLNNVEVEVHFMPMYLNNPLFNSRLQSFFNERGEVVKHQLGGDLTIPAGTTSFNAVYQLTHIYKHLFEEGIGLRQLLDYYFVLRALHMEQGEHSDMNSTNSQTKLSMAQRAEGMRLSVMSNVDIQNVLNQCGLLPFAGAVMYVLREVFAMPDVYMICEPDEKRGIHLLDEIMLVGNFGKYDPRKGNIENESSFHKYIRKTKRNFALAKYYPHEALFEPSFRLYHYFWRKFELWRW